MLTSAGVVASGVGQDESELSGAQIKLTKQVRTFIA